jgi:hypothetical protein
MRLNLTTQSLPLSDNLGFESLFNCFLSRDAFGSRNDLSSELIVTELQVSPNLSKEGSNLYSRGAKTDETQLHITWPALTNDYTGGEIKIGHLCY